MSRTWVAFFTAAIVWFPLGTVIGMHFMRALVRIAKERAWQDGYLCGLEKGRALSRANVVHDLIAADTAATGADRRSA